MTSAFFTPPTPDSAYLSKKALTIGFLPENGIGESITSAFISRSELLFDTHHHSEFIGARGGWSRIFTYAEATFNSSQYFRIAWMALPEVHPRGKDARVWIVARHRRRIQEAGGAGERTRLGVQPPIGVAGPALVNGGVNVRSGPWLARRQPQLAGACALPEINGIVPAQTVGTGAAFFLVAAFLRLM
jgi:hypothetical protein